MLMSVIAKIKDQLAIDVPIQVFFRSRQWPGWELGSMNPIAAVLKRKISFRYYHVILLRLNNKAALCWANR